MNGVKLSEILLFCGGYTIEEKKKETSGDSRQRRDRTDVKQQLSVHTHSIASL